MIDRRLSVFDTLGNVLPGAILVGSILIAVDVAAPTLQMDLVALSVPQLIVLSLISYVVGHAIQGLAWKPAHWLEQAKWGARPAEAMLSDGDRMSSIRRARLREAVSAALRRPDLADDEFRDLAFRVAYERIRSSPSWSRVQTFAALSEFSRGVAFSLALSSLLLWETTLVSAVLTDFPAVRVSLSLLASIVMMAVSWVFVDRFLFFTRQVPSETYEAFVSLESTLPVSSQPQRPTP